MSKHSLFSPSSAHRWMPCPGSLAFPENREDGGSNEYADDGTATHHWAACALHGYAITIGEIFVLNGKEYILDEERATRIQAYVDDVRSRSVGGHLFIETSVDLGPYLGNGQGGTADAAIALPAQRLGIIEDLKDGSGEKVYASYCVKPATDTEAEVREPNPQLALYALGMLPSFELFGEIDHVLLVIFQPKLDHIDEFNISIAALRAFGAKAALAVQLATAAMGAGAQSTTTLGYLSPGARQCRWCRATTKCPALKQFVEAETRSDFEDMTAPEVPLNRVALSRAYVNVPLIEQWCKDVKAELTGAVANGEKILGPDNQPYKFVEGKEGTRAWTDEKAAEAALLGQLSRDKVFSPPRVITAPQAAKLLDKKATKALWNDVFVPLIKRPRGKPILTFGSDPRPAFTGVAETDDFEDELTQ